MDRNESVKTEDSNFSRSESSRYLNVGIAINGSKNSKQIVRWALDKFVPEGNAIMKLIHVRSRIDAVPTSMGKMIPVSQVSEEMVSAYTKEMDWKTNEMLLPYRRMCAKAQVGVDVVVVESENIPNAIAYEIAKSGIRKLVIGASSRGMFTRKPKGLSGKIAVSAPNFCTVYAVSKGKLSSVRHSDTDTVGSSADDNSDTLSVVSDTSSYASSYQTDRSSVASSSYFSSASLTTQRYQALANMNQNLFKARNDLAKSKNSRFQSKDLDERKDSVDSLPRNSDAGRAMSHGSSSGSLVTDRNSGYSDRASVSDAATDCSSSDNQVRTSGSVEHGQVNINFELEKLRIELRHAKGMYAMAQTESNDASRKLNNLNTRLVDESKRLEEISAEEEEAKEALRGEKERHELAKREARYVMQCAEREGAMKREAEAKATHDAKEREKFEAALVGPALQYRDFSWDEIVSATSSFSEDLKVGMGGYGTIYKCSFHHTTAAVKVLNSQETHKSKQFLKELEILSKFHHPHLLLLIGACPEHNCLVYEYMEYGSLEDRLTQKDDTPPIPWFDRYRIAWEVASALAFLHSSKPDPIIHRDLKPANILLDRNLVSKIGDVGLAATLSSDQGTDSAVYRDTGPVGTMCYIDPEYQRTGQISTKSDVYALGMVILQLLTGKPAIALAHAVETAVGDDKLDGILDAKAGDWPVEETKLFAELGLGCTELRRRDRPDLQEKVLPLLQRLKEVAEVARDSVSDRQKLPPPPNHFICPILKEVMSDPYVAADGYTYDRKAIEMWLEANDTSPMTNLPLPGKTLIPNYTLLSAIMEWKSRES